MARYAHLLIFQKTYDLLVRIYSETHNFPREYKYDLGEKMKITSLEILDWVIVANSEENKIPYLKKVSQNVDKLRIYIRLCYSLNVISNKKYEVLSKFVDEIGKMTGGWLKLG
jgi:four helix bundle protein